MKRWLFKFLGLAFLMSVLVGCEKPTEFPDQAPMFGNEDYSTTILGDHVALKYLPRGVVLRVVSSDNTPLVFKDIGLNQFYVVRGKIFSKTEFQSLKVTYNHCIFELHHPLTQQLSLDVDREMVIQEIILPKRLKENSDEDSWFNFVTYQDPSIKSLRCLFAVPPNKAKILDLRELLGFAVWVEKGYNFGENTKP